MRTVAAIFLFTLRSLMRSRFLASMLVLTLGVVLLLPLVVRDDGTLVGRVQVLLRYTLAAVTFLLSVGTLGVAPGLVAGELESRRLQQVLVKPVRFGQVWLGKWLALVALDAAMLGLALLLAQGLLQWNWRGGRLTSDQAAELDRTLLSPRATLAPEPDAAGLAVRAGASRAWRFAVVPKLETRKPLTLRVQFMTARYDERRGLDGEWTAGAPGAEPFFRSSLRLRALIEQELVIPPPPAGLPPVLEVTFTNRETDTVLFHPDRGIRLLVPSGGYAANLARAYALILFKLALLAAIGLAMGSLFSSPVAVLTAFFALALFAFSGYIGWVAKTGIFVEPHHHQHGAEAGHEEEPGPGWLMSRLEPALAAAYRAGDTVLAPVRRLDPMERVAGGERISGAEVGRGFVVLVLAGGGLMAALAIGIFRRREAG